MLMCCECGGKFDESDAKMVQEQVGEYMGRPAYETWLYCPYCDSEATTIVGECCTCDNIDCEFRERDEEDEDD